MGSYKYTKKEKTYVTHSTQFSTNIFKINFMLIQFKIYLDIMSTYYETLFGVFYSDKNYYAKT